MFYRLWLLERRKLSWPRWRVSRSRPFGFMPFERMNCPWAYDIPSQWGWTLQNPKGRLISQQSGGNAETIFSYDPMGRVIWFGQCTPSTCGGGGFTASSSYDWEGNPLSTGDGFAAYTYTYSPANEVLSITSSFNDSQHPPNLVSNVTNGPFGPLTWTLGNGLSGVRRYDGLGRLTGGWTCNGSTSIYCAGGSQVYGFTAASAARAPRARLTQPWLKGYPTGYDEFNRLNSSVVTSGTPQNFTYVYDRYGNRTQQNVTAGAGPGPVYSFNASTNQINSGGFGYDAAGNMTNDSFHSYADRCRGQCDPSRHWTDSEVHLRWAQSAGAHRLFRRNVSTGVHFQSVRSARINLGRDQPLGVEWLGLLGCIARSFLRKRHNAVRTPGLAWNRADTHLSEWPSRGVLHIACVWRWIQCQRERLGCEPDFTPSSITITAATPTTPSSGNTTRRRAVG